MKKLTSNHLFWVAIVMAGLLAGGLSLLIGLNQSVWFDEAYSILLARHSWTEIVSLTAQDVHPPVYYWLLKVWMLLFDSGELALRVFNATLLTLSVGVAGLLLRRLFGTKTTLLALPFIVFAPFLLRYGFEVRMYALASLIGITATYVLVAATEAEAVKRRRVLFAVYALLVALGVYTQYFMALIWIAHLVWLTWVSYQERQRELVVTGIAAYAASFLLFLPWLPVFLSRAGGSTLSSVTQTLGPENLYGIVTYLFLYQPPWNTSIPVVLAVIGILAAIGYLGVRGFRGATAKERRYLVLLAAYFFVPVLIFVVVTHFLPVYLERYVAHIAYGLYAGVGVLAAMSLRRKDWFAGVAAGGLLALLLVGCMSLAQFGNYNFQRVHTPTVKQVASLLTDCRDGAVIFADDPQTAMELMYYVEDCPVYFFNETSEMGGGFAMLSGSPLRVVDATELPDTDTVFQVFYDDPKRSVPAPFYQEDIVKIEALGVVTHRAVNR